MLEEQKYKILNLLAYRYNEICEYFKVKTDSARNWKKAEEIFDLECSINEDSYLLEMLKNDEEEKKFLTK